MTDMQEETGAQMPRRVRHALRIRSLDVHEVRQITPHMLRVTLAGEELEGFTTLGFDDHVKVFFAQPGQEHPDLPVVGAQGIFMPEGLRKPIARDYTVRRHDREKGTLDIDFVLHDDGPATRWAAGVKPGDRAFIAGPRGSFVIPTTYDWHLLIGDETALPAISRRLEELPAGARAMAVIEVRGPLDEQPISSRADVEIIWLHRDRQAVDDSRFKAALARACWPQGTFYTWIACESTVAKSLRLWLIEERAANPRWVRASGYWRTGTAGFHDEHDD